jgi:hypothetical protein
MLLDVRMHRAKNAIKAILKQGYNEYYFAMGDFRPKSARSMTENLLQSADGTKLKIIILLPPSEAGPKDNFDWNVWIEYLNLLKTKYPSSLNGFVIDHNCVDLISNNHINYITLNKICHFFSIFASSHHMHIQSGTSFFL